MAQPTPSIHFNGLLKIYNSVDVAEVTQAEDDLMAEQEAAESFPDTNNNSREEHNDKAALDEEMEGVEEYSGAPPPRAEVETVEEGGIPLRLEIPPDKVSSGSTKPPLKDNAAATSISKVVSAHAKGASEDTVAAYRRLARQLETFVRARNLLPDGVEIFSNKPHESSPDIICAWIMKACDSIDLDTGEAKPLHEERSSYAHAQKMRASTTFTYGRDYGLGSQPWHQSEVTGEMIGNPSVSEKVSLYMMSLRRRKVQAGEEATSARAIKPEMIGSMWDHARLNGYWDLKPFQKQNRQGANPDAWGGPRLRRLLHLAFVLAFLCLLRVDEVLNIRMQDIRLLKDDDGQHYLKLTLPFRKTNQFGKIKPFYLHEMPEELKHLCPIRAFAEWINTTKITHGYLLPKITKTD
ncbi:hypothetical protein AAF712_012306 [Marasmius tenuissimus]|uniref:Tyr recombinase domain-containing protein n=1 Tax=Marasmius tenuissimus TaxID=585030 RepID=A0ABR2ZH41_9AGAR